MAKETHREKLLKLLDDKDWHTNTELAKVAGFRYGAVVFNLRKEGSNIETRKGGEGPGHYEYRLLP